MVRLVSTTSHDVLACLVLTLLVAIGGRAAAQAKPQRRSPRGGPARRRIHHLLPAYGWGQSDQIEAAGDRASCEPDQMRQLSDIGRATARRMGEAIRALDIPVGKVL